jgi:transcriptional regulator with XRE-family HTH domain
MDVQAIGERVKELRAARGWSLRQWAERAEVSHTWIAHVEAGDRPTVDLRKLERLAAAAGVPLSDLLGAEAYEDDHSDTEYDELVGIIAGLPAADRELVMSVARRLHVLQQLEDQGVVANVARYRDGEAGERVEATG